MSTSLRSEQITDTSERVIVAFHGSRGIPRIVEAAVARSVAVRSMALIVNTDDIGADLDEVRELSVAVLVEQSFNPESVNLWVDDLCTDALRLARDLRS